MADGIEGLAESLPGGKTKLGGRSVYIYGAVIGLVVVVWIWWNGRNNPAPSATDFEDTATPSVSGDLGDLPVSTGIGNSQTDDTTTTNAYWETKAVAYLLTQGVQPLAAQQALERYLGGESLDYNQTLIVNKAIAGIGTPPESLLSSPQPTNSPAKTQTLKDAKWTSKTQNLVTVGGIQRYHTNGKPYSGIVKAGTKVTIVQTATVNGVLWGRTLSGVYYRMSDLAKPAATAKPKAAAK